MKTRKLAQALSALALLVAFSGDATAQQRNPEPASTGFRVCNLSGTPLEVAKALNVKDEGKPDIIVSEGWFAFAVGECATLWPGTLKYRYHLLYAQNKSSGKEWKGDRPVCVSREPFTIRHGLCEANSYRRMFFQVDTGDKESWTQNLRP